MQLRYNKYLASVAIAARHQLVQRNQLLGRAFLYCIIVYLFHQIFQSVNASSERLRYLMITEWLVLSTPLLAFQIAEDIRSGQIVYFLLRPMDYLSLRFCECIGTCIVRFVLLGFCCIELQLFLTGNFSGEISTWLIGIVFGILGVMLYNLILLLIGVLAFWLKEIQALIYLNLTATFCFGGLIISLDFYSNFLRSFSFYTPYPWILWAPAGYITGAEINLTAAVLGISIWTILLGGITLFIYRICLQSFVVEGG